MGAVLWHHNYASQHVNSILLEVFSTRQTYLGTLMITLNWQKYTQNGSTSDLEELYLKDKKQYEKVLQVLQDSGSYSSFEQIAG